MGPLVIEGYFVEDNNIIEIEMNETEQEGIEEY